MTRSLLRGVVIGVVGAHTYLYLHEHGLFVPFAMLLAVMFLAATTVDTLLGRRYR